jgi:hypothetical protein
MSTRTNMVLVVWRGHCSVGCDVGQLGPGDRAKQTSN